MSGVFQNIDPPPPTAPRVCTPPAFGGGGTHSLGGEGGGGSIFWKTPDTALYSRYVSTLRGSQFLARTTLPILLELHLFYSVNCCKGVISCENETQCDDNKQCLAQPDGMSRCQNPCERREIIRQDKGAGSRDRSLLYAAN